MFLMQHPWNILILYLMNVLIMLRENILKMTFSECPYNVIFICCNHATIESISGMEDRWMSRNNVPRKIFKGFLHNQEKT